jgi:hypothetical protein
MGFGKEQVLQISENSKVLWIAGENITGSDLLYRKIAAVL